MEEGSSKELGRPPSPINNVEATAEAIRRLEEADSVAYTRPSGGIPQYKPTPKSKTASKSSASVVPEYTPTPKSELQRLKHRSGDLEYDPVSNFSFSSGSGGKGGGYKEEVKYVPTSKKTDSSPEASIQIPKFCSDSALVSENAHFSDEDSGNDNGSNGESVGQNENGSIDPSEFQSPVEDIGGVDKGYGDVSELYSSVKTEGSSERGDEAQDRALVSNSEKKLTKSVPRSSPEKHSKSGKSHSSSSHNHKHSSSSSNKHHSSSSKSSSSQSPHKKSSSSQHSSSKSSSSSHRSSSKSSSRTDTKSSSSSSSGKKSSSHHSSASSTTKHSHSVKSNGSKTSSSDAEKMDRHATKRHSSSKDRSDGEPDAKKAKSTHSSDKSKSNHRSLHQSSGSSSNHRPSTDSTHSLSTDSEASMSKKIRLDAKSSGNRHKDRKLSQDGMASSKSALLRRQSSEVNKELFGEDSDPDEPNQSWDNEEITEKEMQYLQESDFDEEDAFVEISRIYKTEPGVPASIGAAAKRQTENKQPNGKESELGKKRVAHRTSDQIMRRPPPKRKLVINPVQVMMDRQRAIQEAAAAKQAAAAAASPSTSGVSVTPGTPGMKRIAHVPQPSTSKTVAVTADKNQKRIAHVPTQKNLKRPVIPAEYGGKVPTNYRQRYLNLIIDECLKVCSSEEEAFQRGEEEEKDIYKRASSKKLYTNLAVGIICKLRAEGESTSPTGLNGFQFSHNAILGGTHALKTSYTIKRSGSKTLPDKFLGLDLYQLLVKYILTEEQLRSNGFPRPPENGKKGEAKFHTSISREPVSVTASALVGTRDEKVCLRCAKRFIICSDGTYAKQEECVYHWGKAWKKRVAGQIENLYNCCGGDLNSPPCGVARLHVHETNKVENMKGYMTTMPKSPPRDGNYGVFALDCEMVYTFAGIELARVTVIDDKCEVVYESLVKPDSEVIDYNTRFSGLSAKDLVGVKTSLRDVQAVLLQKFSDKTILIGHSLESDLMALRMIHSSVVDTSVVFPHRNGPPQKRALRNIVSDHLQKIIQNDVGGHDSQEDAVACMQLMQWKVKEDAKLELGIK